MNIKEISTSRLREYENNPRNNDLAVEKVKCSIQRFGFLVPVIIDINYVIVCGHTRVRACRELGIPSVPCIIADELSEEQINFFRLVDNKTSEYSDWDFEKLKSELSMIDLTLDENQLMLEQFELSAEVFDIEPEQAEIKIPAFNFMGVNDRPKEKKPTVKTINGSEPEPETEDEVQNPDTFYDTTDGDDDYEGAETSGYAVPPQAGTSDETTDILETASESSFQSADSEQPKAEEPKKSKAVLQFCQFRFGDVAFFISQVELDRLNAKYAEYIDSGEILKRSFADYLLEEVENSD